MVLHIGPEPCRVPVGAMLIWLTDTAPNGWLLCYGQEISRLTYARLFALIGTTFGVGDGSTTFNLPDLRGRLPLGQDDMGGVSANRVTNAQADIIGGNAGDEDIPTHAHNTHSRSGSGSVDSLLAGLSSAIVHSTPTDSTGTGVNNMQPYLTTNYIIKY